MPTTVPQQVFDVDPSRSSQLGRADVEVEILTRIGALACPDALDWHALARDRGRIRELIAALRADDPDAVLTTTAESLRSHAIVFAAEQARRSGRVVELGGPG